MTPTPSPRLFATLVLLAALAAPAPAHAGYDRTFDPGSLIIPMDLAYQDTGTLQAYGLMFQLLRNDITVYWVIDPAKTWHDNACDTVNDECTWDCAEEGSGVKCPYPTASPDFYVAAEVVWDGEGQMAPGEVIVEHGYRGGPFVIDAADAAAAEAIIDVWNDQDEWTANPWAQRTIFHVVTVHRTTGIIDGHVRKEMVTAPTIAVFADGNEDIATSYIRAAGIPQSNGHEFPEGKCGNNDCGPGTDNPDMLQVPSIMGEMGTCDAPNTDHKNGALFTDSGLPAFCQIMSMHWGVNDRETVECGGGDCPGDPADCAGEDITYHGHEVVAEVRQFLYYPTHFFAECQGVNAYENTVPNPAWPYLDDTERRGHFLTTEGYPPDCGPQNDCTDGDFECIELGCDAGTRDCCLPKDNKEIGAGFLIAEQPNSEDIQVLFPDIPYNQFDGFFETTGGSEPAYNLSTYLGTTYINNLDVTFITGPNGPEEQDIWMTGYMDGKYAIGDNPEKAPIGKISYLGGHEYDTNVPVTGSWGTQGARLFLNALFEADCVTTVGQPDFELGLDGMATILVPAFPAEADVSGSYVNNGQGAAFDAVLHVTAPTGASVVTAESGGTQDGDTWSWEVGDVGSVFAHPGDPPFFGNRDLTMEFPAQGSYEFFVEMDYVVALNDRSATPFVGTIEVLLDTDGDGVPDDDDPYPDNADACGDSDEDGCDDCSEGHGFDPMHDGPDEDGDGICDEADDGDDDTTDDLDDGDGADGCECSMRAGKSIPAVGVVVVLFVALVVRLRSRT